MAGSGSPPREHPHHQHRASKRRAAEPWASIEVASRGAVPNSRAAPPLCEQWAMGEQLPHASDELGEQRGRPTSSGRRRVAEVGEPRATLQLMSSEQREYDHEEGPCMREADWP
ncbi:hypothetical protein Dimus_028664 [Dionaea muscipula]